MSNNHQWVIFAKGRMHVTGCANCGEVLLPTNEHAECLRVDKEQNLLIKKGFEIKGPSNRSQEVA
ncbi:hypothetical protein [Pleionea sediminis]|uniref:hypothetical protein n=1 Tax=Pleionea sediminis TaxID=2569479 RepID=UPI0011871FE4|nr:hypothetical protein [Pleionea sediminis]